MPASPAASEGGTPDTLADASGDVDRSRPDQLLYISDLADELRMMAHKLGCSTLAGLLSLAREEAELQRRR